MGIFDLEDDGDGHSEKRGRYLEGEAAEGRTLARRARPWWRSLNQNSGKSERPRLHGTFTSFHMSHSYIANNAGQTNGKQRREGPSKRGKLTPLQGVSPDQAERRQRYIEGREPPRPEAVERDEAGRPTSFGALGSSAADRDGFWRLIAARERFNGRVQSQLIMEMPHELTAAQRRQACEDFCRKAFEQRNLPYWAVVHVPEAKSDGRNFHAHILYYDRPGQRDENGLWHFDQRKARELYPWGTESPKSRERRLRHVADNGVGADRRDAARQQLAELEDWRQAGAPVNRSTAARGRDWLKQLRATYCEAMNEQLALAGHDRRYDPRSYAAMGLNIEAQEHHGPRRSAMARQGKATGAVLRNGERIAARYWGEMATALTAEIDAARDLTVERPVFGRRSAAAADGIAVAAAAAATQRRSQGREFALSRRAELLGHQAKHGDPVAVERGAPAREVAEMRRRYLAAALADTALDVWHVAQGKLKEEDHRQRVRQLLRTIRDEEEACGSLSDVQAKFALFAVLDPRTGREGVARARRLASISADIADGPRPEAARLRLGDLQDRRSERPVYDDWDLDGAGRARLIGRLARSEDGSWTVAGAEYQRRQGNGPLGTLVGRQAASLAALERAVVRDQGLHHWVQPDGAGGLDLWDCRGDGAKLGGWSLRPGDDMMTWSGADISGVPTAISLASDEIEVLEILKRREIGAIEREGSRSAGDRER